MSSRRPLRRTTSGPPPPVDVAKVIESAARQRAATQTAARTWLRHHRVVAALAVLVIVIGIWFGVMNHNPRSQIAMTADGFASRAHVEWTVSGAHGSWSGDPHDFIKESNLAPGRADAARRNSPGVLIEIPHL